MLTLKEFAVPFGLMCLALWVWLFSARPVLLIAAFVATAAAVVLFYKNEDIVQMVFEPRRVLVQMKTIEKNVFAKVEEVRKLAEKMGELTAFSIANLWRFAPEDPVATILQERDRLVVTLKEMGIDDSRIKEITSKIDNTVTLDLARNVWDAVPREIFSDGAGQRVRSNGDQKQINRYRCECTARPSTTIRKSIP